ncbi:SusD/RagB family nutrient-binding outer membrane lipoprotein [Spirosoma sp. BT702]|uniref:SusD/RagB family nutrient-binding outer membrane lipoprotein n=1 Tax=Spirosoma profusum TaxID=2771354 RepID=A0A927ATQ6_9BACT|nr:SusD/RagB family nutrient-binding outer membrane lipoprotein [Spirosoma profusum]MBD2704145.1 SusD/RagB family nutrient-binding outer membrane lipoprotein [Spirosoma profusum]
MKTFNKYLSVGVLSAFLLSSCDKGFDQMNVNPIALTAVDPGFQLNTAIVNSAPAYGNLSYETTIVKQMITPFSGQGSAANFNQDNRSVAAGNWNSYYQTNIKELTDVITKTKSDAARSNLYNMARIWRAYTFMLLTDTYGDIPYTQAGKSYLEGVVTPVYDTQESVYTDILAELDGASAAMDAAKAKVATDIMYDGDVVKWKRMGYSLLLRAAMRLSKVNPTKAAEYVTKAVAGGLMQSNDDNAIIRHTASFTNPIGSQLNGGQSAFFYLADDFVKYLSQNNDPRLASIAVRYVGATSGAQQVESRANRTPAAQIGAPLGYDNTTISSAVTASKLASLWDYSQLDRTRMASLLAPSFLVTYAQTQLLLSEAVFRKWATGDAAALFSNGIRSHMRQFASYGASTAIADAAINTYVTANPLTAGKELEQINTQYWVASFLIGPETWANFRRSGFPVLTPNPYPGSDLKTEPFIRRLTYTDAELNVNKTNVQQAISRQGPNLLDTRIWWDKK